ncbi:hypothetical protein LINGRAHAP2_LOCUS15234 [Linum grandiflorum]
MIILVKGIKGRLK